MGALNFKVVVAKRKTVKEIGNFVLLREEIFLQQEFSLFSTSLSSHIDMIGL